MLAYVTGSVDEELLARNEYLVTENRILRGQPPDRSQCLKTTRHCTRSRARAYDELA